MKSQDHDVAIIGGSVSGLAAADNFVDLKKINEVRVFERQEYDDKRVDCGEAINDATLVPLEKNPSNGFLNNVTGFQLRVYTGTDRSSAEEPLGVSNLRCDAGYICDRDTVEQQWARRLSKKGVVFETGKSVTAGEYHDITEEYDYVVDATGQPSLTHKINDEVPDYTGDMVALNASVKGNFSDYIEYPRIFFEGYVGYSWSFPKSETHANVGIGWAGDQRPNDYMSALEAAAERNGFPVPAQEDVNIYTIPRGPSLEPQSVHIPEDNVFLVGDAAGIANRYQGEGICQGIRSANILAELIAEGRESVYPDVLFNNMKSEYRLARLMRGAWVEHEDPQLLASVAEALEGLTIDDITRQPRRVIGRVIQHPVVATQLVADSGMLKRLLNAYTDTWEYDTRKSV
ncbi:probable FAD-dependent oxidoreductase [Natronomonas moolapensis 8.8.11]|uniref:Probable FAD-dependent oxidoreductase n=1 Tax=Natronomonas moolapensis (strain DSM 18674 / CECT 7526 / JCM 14361 / 8.8.11) TaxID=268739 RepID=M1Y2G6_NATM8|nr:NAD(P)/FAD-dependent oxidoreductase [Natronomonas moolapensis]CCQ36684.1 probable FAD-dependent oxidoreductase [Natronomonas moolapensis 8.8.11]